MRIVSEKRIRAFVQHEPAAAEALWRWADVIESGGWRNPGELKTTFGSASFVRTLTVFNAGGNKYRIVTFVHYAQQIVYIKRIGTHKEYDTWVL